MAIMCIVTYDLSPKNKHLMPWRTLVEVQRHLSAEGHKVKLLSISATELDSNADIADFIHLRRGPLKEMRKSLRDLMDWEAIDALFLPVSWSPNRLMRKLFSDFSGNRIGYLPGGVHELREVSKAIGKMAFVDLVPYLAQALYPNRLFDHSIQDLGIRTLIVNSSYTEAYVNRHTGIQALAIGPGRDLGQAVGQDRCEDIPSSGAGRDKFVYLGPPRAIRGVFVLLDAYLKASSRSKIPDLWCYFRADANLDIPQIKREIEARYSSPNIHFIWKSLTPIELSTCLNSAISVMMPFLVVPSEIPLAVFEAAGQGATVVTSGPSGTGEFVAKFGCVTSPGSVEQLAAALELLGQNVHVENVKAKVAFSELPSWSDVARAWLDASISHELDTDLQLG